MHLCLPDGLHRASSKTSHAAIVTAPHAQLHTGAVKEGGIWWEGGFMTVLFIITIQGRFSQKRRWTCLQCNWGLSSWVSFSLLCRIAFEQSPHGSSWLIMCPHDSSWVLVAFSFAQALHNKFDSCLSFFKWMNEWHVLRRIFFQSMQKPTIAS